ncbi:helix-turn-helix domain-containing protein [Thomasclavelia cocleata]|uniref:helix-turn-helix domain-containing protein n=1 Tax=Thomasclavelia cocleata TaxID=69824 RepID=UPI00272CA312|nr:helix-turn-helix transcriptional regulator [Thomasclavelia cocleata]
MSNLSERLQSLKIERNLLQKDIANKNNISLRAYQYYERGEREPTSSILISLADYFDVSIDYLVGRSDDPHRY